MDKVIHAHTLLDFIQENPKMVSIQELKTKFEEQYGAVQFTNCTNQIYDFEGIYNFLSQRNKVQSNSEGINVSEEHKCDH